jgi:hypothetical protein
MANEKVKAAIVLVAIFAIVGGVSWALVSAQQSAEQNENPENMPQLTLQEQIRGAVMEYLGSNHPETLQFMDNLTWSGGRVTPENLLGAETYTYQAQGWEVTIHYPVVMTPLYEITVDYSTTSGGVSIPYSVSWTGTWQDGCVTEASYVFAQ